MSEEKLDLILQRLDSIDARLDKIETRLEKAEASLIELAGDVREVKGILQGAGLPCQSGQLSALGAGQCKISPR